MLFDRAGITPAYFQRSQSVDPGRRIATFFPPPQAILETGRIIACSFRHNAHLTSSSLGVELGRQMGTDQGWLNRDIANLRHCSYPDIFCTGDVAGRPKGVKPLPALSGKCLLSKTTLLRLFSGPTEGNAELMMATTSCPLIHPCWPRDADRVDYNNNLTPSFPGINCTNWKSFGSVGS